jgi:hypothetical protein
VNANFLSAMIFRNIKRHEICGVTAKTPLQGMGAKRSDAETGSA